MRKAATVFLCALLAMVMMAGAAWAKPGGDGNGQGNQDKGSGIQKEIKTVVQDGKVNGNQRTGDVETARENRTTCIEKLQQKLKQHQELGEQTGTRQLFRDTERHWAQNAIHNAAAIGILKGYSDGTFKPDQPVTQAEVIAIMIRMVTPETDEDEDSADPEDEEVEDDTTDQSDTDEDSNDVSEVDEDLSDVPGWARGAVGKAAELQVININRFHSQVQATRLQAAVWVAKSLGLEPADVSEMPFVDGTLITSEDAGYIMALYEEGIINGMPDGKFNPNSAVTRAQIAAMIEKILADEEQDQDDVVDGEDDDNDDDEDDDEE